MHLTAVSVSNNPNYHPSHTPNSLFQFAIQIAIEFKKQSKKYNNHQLYSIKYLNHKPVD